MTQKTEHLINLLAQKSINYYDFIHLADNNEELSDLFEVKDLSMWKFLGLDVIKLDNGKITLKTRATSIDDQTFCIVDIETNGGINSGQIIEIGAIKVKNWKIIDKFDTLVYGESIPENISILTGIYPKDLANAPKLACVLERFRLFLGDSVFIAHNVKFDYNFISSSLEKFDFGILLNRAICTIDLSRRTISSEKYGLSSLKEMFGIENIHHRAMSDAISCYKIFKECTKRLPWHVQSVEDLITFSKTAKSLKMLPNQKKLS